MRRTCEWMFLGLLLAAPVLLAQSIPAPAAGPDAVPATTSPRNSHKAQKPVVLPLMTGSPLSQLPMDQIPPSPAKVSFQGGMLEISAQNSTLGEILRDVRKLTGAAIEIPQGANGANERVVTHLGPGAPRDVLAVLLNGSSFNYVMVGSSSDPTAVSSVILSAKPSASGDTQTQTAANVYRTSPQPLPPNRFPVPGAFNQPMVQQPGQSVNAQAVNVQPATPDGDDKDDQDNAEETADDQLQPEQTAQSDTTDANTPVQQQQPDPSQPNAGPKTPEQILEMLRHQQQPGGGIVPPPVPPAAQPPQQ